MVGWIPALGAVLAPVVVLAVGAAALVVPGAAADRAPRCAPVEVRPSPPEAHAPPAPPLPPAPPAPPEPEAVGPGGSLTQTLRVEVIGGPLLLREEAPRVELVPLHPGARRLVGTLPWTEVIDARGTHAGWTLGWSVARAWVVTPGGRVPVGPGRVTLAPGDPVPVYGAADGMRPGPRCRGAGLLARAQAGAGAGTHAVSATVTVDVPGQVRPTGAVVVLQLALG